MKTRLIAAIPVFSNVFKKHCAVTWLLFAQKIRDTFWEPFTQQLYQKTLYFLENPTCFATIWSKREYIHINRPDSASHATWPHIRDKISTVTVRNPFHFVLAKSKISAQISISAVLDFNLIIQQLVIARFWLQSCDDSGFICCPQEVIRNNF